MFPKYTLVSFTPHSLALFIYLLIFHYYCIIFTISLTLFYKLYIRFSILLGNNYHIHKITIFIFFLFFFIFSCFIKFSDNFISPWSRRLFFNCNSVLITSEYRMQYWNWNGVILFEIGINLSDVSKTKQKMNT